MNRRQLLLGSASIGVLGAVLRAKEAVYAQPAPQRVRKKIHLVGPHEDDPAWRAWSNRLEKERQTRI